MVEVDVMEMGGVDRVSTTSCNLSGYDIFQSRGRCTVGYYRVCTCVLFGDVRLSVCHCTQYNPFSSLQELALLE